MKPTDAELTNRFTYHAPDEDRRRRHRRVTEILFEAAKEIRDLTPASRQQSLVLTKLEEARMWANAAIACNIVSDQGGTDG